MKGERVKCVDVRVKIKTDFKFPLIENRDYIVYDSAECNCGHVTYDVGFTIPVRAAQVCRQSLNPLED